MIDFTTFMTIFIILAGITTLTTEAIKKTLDNLNVKYINEVVVLIVDFIASLGVSISYFIIYDISFSAKNIIAIVGLVLANYVASTVGYDKVVEFLKAIKK